MNLLIVPPKINQVLDKPGSVYAIIYLGGRLPCRSSSLPAAIAGQACCILGLAPGGVCHALSITVQAVVSYTAVSPLPVGGLFSAALSVALPLLAVNQHHRPVEPGLSSFRRLLPEPGKILSEILEALAHSHRLIIAIGIRLLAFALSAALAFTLGWLKLLEDIVLLDILGKFLIVYDP